MYPKESIKIIGKSTKLQEVLRTADLVAGTDVPVLITGDTGTGKDTFAHRIHQQSSRKKHAFVKINCASNAIESALFDVNNKGAVYQARSGTLFLDDISALTEPLQFQLLQLIEGDKLKARIIAASHKHLSDEVNAGKFRADLFYRLNVIPVELPALKERDGDVVLLMDFFLRRLVYEQHQVAPSFTSTALKLLSKYDWPGNVRELYNFCERMFILFSGRKIEISNLPNEFRQLCQSFDKSKNKENPFSLPSEGIQLEKVEVYLIHQALQATDGNKSRAARLLGLTRDTFLYRLKKYAIGV